MRIFIRSKKTRKKISLGLKKSWAKPGRKKNSSAKMKEVWERPGMRERLSRMMRRAHQRPEVKLRHSRGVLRWCRKSKARKQRCLVQQKYQKKVEHSLRLQGFKIIKYGWPDFLAVRGKEIRAIEAKAPAAKLNPRQQKMHALLNKIGLKVEIIHATN